MVTRSYGIRFFTTRTILITSEYMKILFENVRSGHLKTMFIVFNELGITFVFL